MRLGQDRLGAAPADGGAFVDGDGAEAALAEAAAVGGDGLPDRLERADGAAGAVERVEGLCQKCGPVLITDWSWEDLFGEEDLPAHD